MHRHLVTIEVGVECGADQRVELYRLAFDEFRVEGLDAEAVERGCSVEQHGVAVHYLFESVPDFVIGLLGASLGGFDVVGVAFSDQAVHDERLEQFQRHLLGDAAFIEFHLRTRDDDRATAVVDPLAE